jgi:hypothetical protein
MIAHPASPYKGKHYSRPVELIDVYATINELLRAPYDKKSICKTGTACLPLQGKSLAPVVLGSKIYQKNFGKSVVKTYNATGDDMPIMLMDFAISQLYRCAPKNEVEDAAREAEAARNQSVLAGHRQQLNRKHFWNDCDINQKNQRNEVATLGYSMRTTQYRYTAYFYFNKTTERPDTTRLPFEEELFDHRNETLADFTHRETYNLARKSSYAPIVARLRTQLVQFIARKIVFRIPLKK